MSVPDSNIVPVLCTKCGLSPSAGSKRWCKECVAEYDRQYRARNVDRLKAKARIYYEQHRDERIAAARAWAQAHPEKRRSIGREYYETNIAKVTAAASEWARAHPEAARQRGAEYRAKYPEKRAATCRRWRQSNPDQVNAETHNRRMRLAGNEGVHTGEDIRAQYERQKGKCFYCREKVGKKYHVDHVVPTVAGGTNGPENLVITCPSCNLRKGAKHPMDFAGILF